MTGTLSPREWREILDGARCAFPTIRVPERIFRDRVVRAAALPPRRCPRSLAAADLYLATACAHGLPDAWERLDRAVRHSLIAVANECRVADSEGIVQQVLADLAGADSVATTLADYHGRGSIKSWLTTIVARRCRRHAHVDANRRQRLVDLARVVRAEHESTLEVLVRAEQERKLRRAIRGALRSLSERERIVIERRLRGESGLAIGNALGVTPSRISQLFASAQRHVRSRIARESIVQEPDARTTPASTTDA